MKSFKSVGFVILFLVCIQTSLQAQIVNDQDLFSALPERFVFQVKQMDEFIQRFNAEENHEGMKINPESISMDDRAMILASLFNLDLMKDPSFRESATSFVRQIATNKFYGLSFYDKNNYATVDCQVKFKGNKERLTLNLVMDGNAQSGSRWAIHGANAEFLISKSARVQEGMIPPTNHEIDFIELLNVFNGQKDLKDYVSFNHKPNQLDILTYAIKNGEIEMLSTSTPTFHFNQIPGWTFSVDLFNRNSNNSGWLISNLKNIDPETQETIAENNVEIPSPPEKSGEASVDAEEKTEAPVSEYEVVDEMPYFDGGLGEFYSQLGKNLKYPQSALSRNIQGKVYVSYVVDIDGSITEARVLKGIGYGCDEEALRAILKAPKWNPGRKAGEPVRVRMVLPITFSLLE